MNIIRLTLNEEPRTGNLIVFQCSGVRAQRFKVQDSEGISVTLKRYLELGDLDV
jgi:hypothetical protein